MNSKIDFCPECSSSDIHEEICPGQHRVCERTVHISEDRHIVCATCGEWSYPGDMVGDMQRKVAFEIRRIDGLVSLDDLKSARLRYGFTQLEMDSLMSLNKQTWARLERGKVTQTSAMDREIRRFIETGT